VIVQLYRALLKRESVKLLQFDRSHAIRPLLVVDDDSGDITKGGLSRQLLKCVEPHLHTPAKKAVWWDVKNFVPEGAAARRTHMENLEKGGKGMHLLDAGSEQVDSVESTRLSQLALVNSL
jgi:hypothetical protein